MLALFVVPLLSMADYVPVKMNKQEKFMFLSQLVWDNCPQAELQEYEHYGGWGLAATGLLRINDLVCSVPQELVFSSFDEYPWTEHFSNENGLIRITAELIYEKFVNTDTSSNRWKYVNSLPEHVRTVLSWSEDQIKQIREWSD